MKIALTTLCLLLGIVAGPHIQAQSYLFGPTVSYQYQKGNILKTGVYYATSINTSNILKLDATANFTWIQNKHAVIPEVAATFFSDMYILGLFARTEFTPYTVTPKIGISALTVLELDLGYGFPMVNKANYRPIKGFTTSLRFNIPLNTRL